MTLPLSLQAQPGCFNLSVLKNSRALFVRAAALVNLVTWKNDLWLAFVSPLPPWRFNLDPFCLHLAASSFPRVLS